ANDLLVTARHNWILNFDHISALPQAVAEALCRLSSGIGASFGDTWGRDREPVQQSLRRPIMLTVTDRWSCPPDMAERVLVVDLPYLPPAARRSEAGLLERFHNAWPAI